MKKNVVHHQRNIFDNIGLPPVQAKINRFKNILSRHTFGAEVQFSDYAII